MQPPGTADAAYITFAVMDELLRTIIDQGVFTRDGVAKMIDRAGNNLSKTKALSSSSLPLLREMANEYRK